MNVTTDFDRLVFVPERVITQGGDHWWAIPTPWTLSYHFQSALGIEANWITQIIFDELELE